MAASIVGYRLWDQDTTVMPAALADCSAALAAAHASVSRSGAARLASILASTRLSETSASRPDWAAPAGSTNHRAMAIRPRSRHHNIASTTQSSVVFPAPSPPGRLGPQAEPATDTTRTHGAGDREWTEAHRTAG